MLSESNLPCACIPRAFSIRLRWVSITPFGLLVDPEVYWIIATESKDAAKAPSGERSSPCEAQSISTTGARWLPSCSRSVLTRLARSGVVRNAAGAASFINSCRRNVARFTLEVNGG